MTKSMSTLQLSCPRGSEELLAGSAWLSEPLRTPPRSTFVRCGNASAAVAE